MSWGDVSKDHRPERHSCKQGSKLFLAASWAISYKPAEQNIITSPRNINAVLSLFVALLLVGASTSLGRIQPVNHNRRKKSEFMVLVFKGGMLSENMQSTSQIDCTEPHYMPEKGFCTFCSPASCVWGVMQNAVKLGPSPMCWDWQFSGRADGLIQSMFKNHG